MPEHQLSLSTAALKRSIMRDLMPKAVDPGIISFAGGLPANDCQPVEELASCLDLVLRRDGPASLQYGPPFAPLREWIAAHMRSMGVPCVPEQIQITNGAQQGLAILSRLFADPGDPAVIEAVTFTGIQQATAGRRLLVRAVPTNLQTGVDLEALERSLCAAPRPRFAIFIPDFHNPLGVSISAEKRELLVELTQRAGVPLIEDDPYSPLRFEGRPLQPLTALAASGSALYIGSFSKMLAPAVRLGWIVVPENLIARTTVMRESLDLESSQLMQRAVAEFLARGDLEKHLQRLNATNLRRRDALIAAMRHEFGPLEIQWTTPSGGLFTWVTLPEFLDARELLGAALEAGVAFIPGGAFAVAGDQKNTLRLNFSNAGEAKLQEGVRRLAGVIREAIAAKTRIA